MARSRLVLNKGGMKEILNSPGVRADLTKRAERVLAKAQAEAPVVDGDYRDGLRIQQRTHDRAVVQVVGTAPHTLSVEAEHGTLTRALDAAGGD